MSGNFIVYYGNRDTWPQNICTSLDKFFFCFFLLRWRNAILSFFWKLCYFSVTKMKTVDTQCPISTHPAKQYAVWNRLDARQTKISRNFRRKVLSTFLRIPNVLLRNDKRFQKFICVFLVDKCSELVHIIISLGCRARLPGTVSNGLNARQLEIFTKMPLKGSFKLLKSIRC